MTTEIVEKVIMEEFKIEENRNPHIVTRESKILDSKAVKELLKSEAFKELKRRIHDGDENALAILMTAKEKVKHDLPIYTNTLKLTIMALKPFYLIALISLMTQSPVNA
jgi:hypothetical protein